MATPVFRRVLSCWSCNFKAVSPNSHLATYNATSALTLACPESTSRRALYLMAFAVRKRRTAGSVSYLSMISATMNPGTGMVFGIVTPNDRDIVVAVVCPVFAGRLGLGLERSSA